jgi:hypothetical protein
MPADQFPEGDPFHALEGKDGFHVVQTDTGSVLMLSVMAYAGGVPCNVIDNDPANTSVELLDHTDPTPQQRGAVERLRLVMDAVCRYFTTGGSWLELGHALKTAAKVITDGIQFPGYHLVTSYSTTDGDYQHVFAKDGTTLAVLWNEPEIGDSGLPVGGWIQSTTLEQIREEQADDEDVWGPRTAGEAEEAAAAGEGHPLPLPGRAGVRAAEAPEGSPGAGVPGDDAG